MELNLKQCQLKNSFNTASELKVQTMTWSHFEFNNKSLIDNCRNCIRKNFRFFSLDFAEFWRSYFFSNDFLRLDMIRKRKIKLSHLRTIFDFSLWIFFRLANFVVLSLFFFRAIFFFLNFSFFFHFLIVVVIRKNLACFRWNGLFKSTAKFCWIHI